MIRAVAGQRGCHAKGPRWFMGGGQVVRLRHRRSSGRRPGNPFWLSVAAGRITTCGRVTTSSGRCRACWAGPIRRRIRARSCRWCCAPGALLPAGLKDLGSECPDLPKVVRLLW